ncbi:S9 family peptidase [Paraglaciecola sp.]|uniref:alpha/beta hydrolase family protein n=1 Tax=Paraglaciecola sp. TaxID=1920173 RepID=UPI00273F3B21|nr:prolyl oligopeptidase family serine peptidase [Paraglaciecola sp.]MDP5029644.1 prolyl oligopeptidase family serine peptidase [Paraglaciecola sp.]
MKLFLVFFYLTLISIFCHANDGINDSRSCFRGSFESHESWFAYSATKKNFNKERFLAYFPKSKFNERKDTLECVDFTYQVDGLTIEGYYLKPKQHDNKKLPLVIFNRGGNADFGYVGFNKKMDFIADIATHGYVVIGSQYRGASTRFIQNNGNDEFGGNDVNDVIALVTLAESIPNVDSANIALVGWSRGVMQSYLAAKKLKNVKTIVAIAGNADAEKALAIRPEMERVYQARIPDFQSDRANQLAQRSVIKWVDRLPADMPILLVHGSEDERVNVEQSLMLAAVLSEQAYPHKLVIFAGGNHGLDKNRSELIELTINWLDNYLKPK